MTARFALAAFLERWRDHVRHDLSGSDSETLPLADLLALAGPADRDRWERLAFGYAEPLGAPWLREAIARRHRVVDAQGIVCCAGAQEAVSCVARALLSSDDHAIVLLPIYQPSEEAVTALCPTTGVPLEGPDWQPDLDRVAAAIRPNTRLVLANFPNSPTGAVLDPDRLAALVALCRRHGLWLVNDEVYQQTEEAADATARPTVADAYERGVSINGLSKGFGLPGLRVGWAASRDPGLRDGIVAAKSRLSTCLSGASEILAHVALQAEEEIVRRSRRIGAQNRQSLQGILARHADLFAHDPLPNHAFGFPRYRGPGHAEGFAERLAHEAGILLLPSTLWASSLSDGPTGHLRIGLGHARNGQDLARLDEHLGRIARA